MRVLSSLQLVAVVANEPPGEERTFSPLVSMHIAHTSTPRMPLWSAAIDRWIVDHPCNVDGTLRPQWRTPRHPARRAAGVSIHPCLRNGYELEL